MAARKKTRKKATAKRVRKSVRKRRAKVSPAQLLRMLRAIKGDIRSIKRELGRMPKGGIIVGGRRRLVNVTLFPDTCVRPIWVVGEDCRRKIPKGKRYDGSKLEAMLDRLDGRLDKAMGGLKKGARR